MYREIWRKYGEELSGFPKLRRPPVGAVIKGFRVDKGISQMDFAKRVGINLSTLKSIENDHQQATTAGNLSRCTKELGLSVDDLILFGRELDPANYFVFKRTPPPAIKGIRKRKRFPDEWRETIRMRFSGFDLTPISPPIYTKRDFFVSRINLPPKNVIEKLTLGAHHPVVGFVPAGFNVKIVAADGNTVSVNTNQGFALDGCFPHSIINDDEDHAAVIYLVTRFPNFERLRVSNEPPSAGIENLDVAQGVKHVREYASDRPGHPISIEHLADLTDSLDREQVAKLMRTKKGSSVIYWERIEDLLAGTGVSMEDFLTWCHEREKTSLATATISNRALIDYGTQHGVKIYTSVPPGIGNDFFLGELMVEGKAKVTRKTWKRKDDAMIALYVEEGDLEIAVGRQRSALTISKGESIYFDGSLGYVVRNPGEVQAKGFFATCPAIRC